VQGNIHGNTIEYHKNTIYFVGNQAQTGKHEESNVCIGISPPYTGWDSAKGAQITGKQDNFQRTRPGLKASAYQWEKTAKDLA
jgi:hypothetical protein